jgi:hypothetical protein
METITISERGMLTSINFRDPGSKPVGVWPVRVCRVWRTILEHFQGDLPTHASEVVETSYEFDEDGVVHRAEIAKAVSRMILANPPEPAND